MLHASNECFSVPVERLTLASDSSMQLSLRVCTLCHLCSCGSSPANVDDIKNDLVHSQTCVAASLHSFCFIELQFWSAPACRILQPCGMMTIQENRQGPDDPEDLQSKLAALERAMVDRDLLILRQNEDIASLEEQLARASLERCAARLQNDIPDTLEPKMMRMRAATSMNMTPIQACIQLRKP